MAVWFSSSAVLPQVLNEVALSPVRSALLTSSVQAGFVIGTLVSALLGLADRLDPRRFFMACAILAASSNFPLAFLPPDSLLVPALRFVTGISMAGVYPVGMRIAATWAKGDTGLLIGLLVGALTLGSASPHLLAALGGLDWRLTYFGSSLSALIAATLIGRVELGPGMRSPARFNPRFQSQLCARHLA